MIIKKGTNCEYDFYATRLRGGYTEKGLDFHQARFAFDRMVEETPDEMISLGVSYCGNDGNVCTVDLARYKDGVVSLSKSYKTDPVLTQEKSFSKVVNDLIEWIVVWERKGEEDVVIDRMGAPKYAIGISEGKVYLFPT